MIKRNIFFEKYPLFLLFIALLMSCSSAPESILYGKENCTFCKMTIIDSRFGAELVTQKGKVFKFDDLSCLAKYMNINNLNEEDFCHIVVCQYDKPNNLIKVKSAGYIYSPALQSPMMGNIAAFSNEVKCANFLKENKESVQITWADLMKKLK